MPLRAGLLRGLATGVGRRAPKGQEGGGREPPQQIGSLTGHGGAPLETLGEPVGVVGRPETRDGSEEPAWCQRRVLTCSVKPRSPFPMASRPRGHREALREVALSVISSLLSQKEGPWACSEGLCRPCRQASWETRERGQGVCRLQGASLKHISPRAGILPSSPTQAWGAAPRSHTSRPRAPLLPHEGSGRGGGGRWIDPQVPVLPELVKADARSRWLGDQLQNKSSGWRGLGSLCVEQGNYHHKLGAKDSSPRDLCSQGVPLE